MENGCHWAATRAEKQLVKIDRSRRDECTGASRECASRRDDKKSRYRGYRGHILYYNEDFVLCLIYTHDLAKYSMHSHFQTLILFFRLSSDEDSSSATLCSFTPPFCPSWWTSLLYPLLVAPPFPRSESASNTLSFAHHTSQGHQEAGWETLPSRAKDKHYLARSMLATGNELRHILY